MNFSTEPTFGLLTPTSLCCSLSNPLNTGLRWILTAPSWSLVCAIIITIALMEMVPYSATPLRCSFFEDWLDHFSLLEEGLCIPVGCNRIHSLSFCWNCYNNGFVVMFLVIASFYFIFDHIERIKLWFMIFFLAHLVRLDSLVATLIKIGRSTRLERNQSKYNSKIVNKFHFKNAGHSVIYVGSFCRRI